jgi:hypothetical protein
VEVTFTVDKAGRIILPKQLRESMHIVPGSKLKGEFAGGLLQVSMPEEEDPPFKVVDGISVIMGGGPIPGGVAAAVRRERDAIADRALRRP